MDKKVIYANSIVIGITPIDCNIALSTIVSDKDMTGKITGNTVTDSVEVFLSLQHVKLFSKLLNEQIEIFEKQNGEIKIPVPPSPKA
jgi:predicted transcriptional regulator